MNPYEFRVGDLVKFRQNEALGLILAKLLAHSESGLFRVQWCDGLSPVQSRYGRELEVISESR